MKYLLAKYGVFIIQMRLRCIGEEKLRCIRVGTAVGHGKHASSVVPAEREREKGERKRQ